MAADAPSQSAGSEQTSRSAMPCRRRRRRRAGPAAIMARRAVDWRGTRRWRRIDRWRAAHSIRRGRRRSVSPVPRVNARRAGNETFAGFRMNAAER
jgi:hypothetical protein